MKMRTFFVLLLLLICTVVGLKVCRADVPWKSRMQSLAASLTCLVPYLADDAKFEDPKNKAQIKNCAAQLWQGGNELNLALSQHAKSSGNAYKQDPLLPLMATVFADDLTIARSVLDSSNSKYAQHLLRQSTIYCVSCHTRKESDSKAWPFPSFVDQLKGASAVERMRYLAATRNFDDAIKEYQSLLAPEAKEMPPLQFEQATRLALLIAMNVKNSDDRAMKLIDQILKSKKPSSSLREELQQWRSTITSVFKTDPSRSKAEANLETADALLKSAAARAASDPYHVPALYYMRAAAFLHAALEGTLSDEKMAQALYELGVCYDHLESFGFWSIAEIYYESCIQKAPHTPLAGKCFESYKDDITIGYSGSAGVQIPPEIQKHLNELEKTSKASSAEAGKEKQ